jgi:flagellar basal body-associated protein FliL
MENNNLLIILIALLVIVIIGAGGFFFFSKSQQYKLIDEMKTLKIKMTVLEQDFMKGKMDETTYRRLMEQYQIQLNDLKTKYSTSKGVVKMEIK